MRKFTFEERMQMLDDALKKYTPEQLLQKLQSYPAHGPCIISDEEEQDVRKNAEEDDNANG